MVATTYIHVCRYALPPLLEVVVPRNGSIQHLFFTYSNHFPLDMHLFVYPHISFYRVSSGKQISSGDSGNSTSPLRELDFFSNTLSKTARRIVKGYCTDQARRLQDGAPASRNEVRLSVPGEQESKSTFIPSVHPPRH